MQHAKDSFYGALRERLARLNPARVVAVRGAVRPAVLVKENELPSAEEPSEAFILEWGSTRLDRSEPLGLHTAECTVRYTVAGTHELLLMDRGRMLDAMDGELRLLLQPAVAAKVDFTADPPATLATRIFWSAAQFGPVVGGSDRLTRTVTLTVCALNEEDE